MSEWSLTRLLADLHADIERRLEIARRAIGHDPSKGDASETIWLELFRQYLPARYQSERAHVVDSRGTFSEQIDVVVFDRQYSPFIFHFEGQKVVPAESVYAVFEAKQTVNAEMIRYAGSKAATVRALHRTSLPIPHAGGVYEPKPPPPILAGILAFESDWTPPIGASLEKALRALDQPQSLDIGCVAARGFFHQRQGTLTLVPGGKPATGFLLELIARLQELATVPMIDVRAYAAWLEK